MLVDIVSKHAAESTKNLIQMLRGWGGKLTATSPRNTRNIQKKLGLKLKYLHLKDISRCPTMTAENVSVNTVLDIFAPSPLHSSRFETTETA